ncbi:hypothetical protein PHISP_02026 [Aspergillus sp. HF37]|nr:hypothetical protein PHISP_02026 [Aspergillus sp. HF37]
MLGAVRRYGVAQALRASVPRSLHARSTPQLLKLQPSSVLKVSNAARPFHNFPQARSAASAAAQEDRPVRSESAQENAALHEFADLQKRGLVDPKIIETIARKMNITAMTDVQSQTFHKTLQGNDVLAQAKTGTGKTIAYLVPVLQSLMNSPRSPPSGRGTAEVRSMIISPTRELAEQIAVQARLLAAGTGLKVQTAVGGSGKQLGLNRIRGEGCDLLIGTPGRIEDILSDKRAGVRTSTLSSLVLDEADRLLDQGFAADLMRIIDLLPSPMKVDRQTLMFSATVPNEVMDMVRRAMKPKFDFVKTVRDDEAPTHLTVPQKAVMLNGLENGVPATLEIAKSYEDQMRNNHNLPPFKAIVYFNTTAEVNLVYEVASKMKMDRSTPVFVMHSRLTQRDRTRNAGTFRRQRSAILISSDVTARGMDFPDVTHVIQVGAPRDRDSYIHRLGRTARANKTGEGWILLNKGEIPAFNRLLGDLPIDGDKSLSTAAVDMTNGSADAPPAAQDIIGRVNNAMADVDYRTKSSAFMSLLSGASGGQSKQRFIDGLNRLAIHGYGLEEPPSVSPLIAQRTGLDRVRGVNIKAHVPYDNMVGGDRRMSRGGLGSRGGGFNRSGSRNRNESSDDLFGVGRFNRSGLRNSYERNDRFSGEKDTRFQPRSRDFKPSF